MTSTYTGIHLFMLLVKKVYTLASVLSGNGFYLQCIMGLSYILELSM